MRGPVRSDRDAGSDCWAVRIIAMLLSLSAASAHAETPLPALYTLHCSGCHGEDGVGVPSRGIPDLKDSGYYLSVPQGRRYLIEVPGLSQSTLNDAQVAELLNYILKRFSPGQHAEPYSAAEVTKFRGDKASDAESRRNAVLAQLQKRSD